KAIHLETWICEEAGAEASSSETTCCEARREARIGCAPSDVTTASRGQEETSRAQSVLAEAGRCQATGGGEEHAVGYVAHGANGLIGRDRGTRGDVTTGRD